ncbi:transcriptional regulator [Rothia nasimurium]|uniref:Transcriptional regulator n=1 Tax=Rothia nasimurium TaxID=85336 RepID=A0A4Y9F332_9MICC|nr:metalloregulator ArsR/SmtB family transcription factor [Rothia nasimurium]MBF0808303.1 metalloregulator ArsR/SmtB family transcription factor [Rothia nasimurium]TFU22253.1 transcriptional regulator [Rothia nasimurium]
MKDDVFAVIADPTRRHILQALAVERLAVGELVEELGVSQPTVSKHLKVLRTAGLVETEAVGQKRFYSLAPAPLATVTDWVDGLLAAPVAETTPALEAVPAAEATSVANESSESAHEANPAAPETTSVPDEQEEVSAPAVDVPHPNTAGITFTPLTPFTPVLDNRVDEEVAENQAPAEVEQDAVSDQVRQLAQSLSLGVKDEGPISFKVPTPEQVVAQEAAAKANDEQAHKQAGDEEGDDRGLLAKLTRWGRRSSR